MEIELARVSADNGEHSHWRAVNVEDGTVVWSENPEEDKALGIIVQQGNVLLKIELDKLVNNWPDCFESLRVFRLKI